MTLSQFCDFKTFSIASVGLLSDSKKALKNSIMKLIFKPNSFE